MLRAGARVWLMLIWNACLQGRANSSELEDRLELPAALRRRERFAVGSHDVASGHFHLRHRGGPVLTCHTGDAAGEQLLRLLDDSTQLKVIAAYWIFDPDVALGAWCLFLRKWKRKALLGFICRYFNS